MAIEALGVGTWGNLTIGEQKKVVEMEIWKSAVLSKWQVGEIDYYKYSHVYLSIAHEHSTCFTYGLDLNLVLPPHAAMTLLLLPLCCVALVSQLTSSA
jgi:hypothetical protein